MKGCRRLQAVTGMLLAISMSGCAGRGLPRAELPDIPVPVSGFSALCHVSWSGQGGKGRARVAVAYLAPDHLRLEVLDPMGNSRVVLVAGPDGALLLNPSGRRFHTYDAGRDATAAMMGIAAPPELIARFLLGPAATREGLLCDTRGDGKEGGVLRCRLPGGEELRFSSQAMERAELYTSSGARAVISWKMKKGRSAGPASSLEMRQGAPQAALRIRLEDLRFRAPDPSLFTLRAPEGFVPAGAKDAL